MRSPIGVAGGAPLWRGARRIGYLSQKDGGAEHDLSKAFDTVDHAVLRAALSEKQFFAHVIWDYVGRLGCPARLSGAWRLGRRRLAYSRRASGGQMLGRSRVSVHLARLPPPRRPLRLRAFLHQRVVAADHRLLHRLRSNRRAMYSARCT